MTKSTVSIRQQVYIRVSKLNRVLRFTTFNNLREEHIAMDNLEDGNVQMPYVRIHSECLTGDLFGSTRCDCGRQLWSFLNRLKVGGGVLIYMRQEGRGIGLYNKLDAYALQDRGRDTFVANEELGFDADLREYESAARMLDALGVTSCRLVTNNPKKAETLIDFGFIVEVENSERYWTPENERYLKAKLDRNQ